MGPAINIGTVFAKTFSFSGRASRREYWWYTLFYHVIILICGFLDVSMVIALAQQGGEEAVAAVGIFEYKSVFAWIILMPPLISLTVRRLRDAGFSGLWAFLFFVPLGIVALLIMHMLPSSSTATVHGAPASAPSTDRTGKPVTADAQQRAMQGYALLFDKDKTPSQETQAARKAEISDYYRKQVLKSAPSA